MKFVKNLGATSVYIAEDGKIFEAPNGGAVSIGAETTAPAVGINASVAYEKAYKVFKKAVKRFDKQLMNTNLCDMYHRGLDIYISKNEVYKFENNSKVVVEKVGAHDAKLFCDFANITLVGKVYLPKYDLWVSKDGRLFRDKGSYILKEYATETRLGYTSLKLIIRGGERKRVMLKNIYRDLVLARHELSAKK
jgi:hypothetical protein